MNIAESAYPAFKQLFKNYDDISKNPWLELNCRKKDKDSEKTNLNLLVAVVWWIGPKKRLVGDRYVASARGVMVARFLLEEGELANLTVIGSTQPSGMWLFSF